MHPIAPTTGLITQGDTPDWAPLEAAIGAELAGWFMWMYEVRLADHRRIQAYKHVVTRRYLHLSADGSAFDYRAPNGAYLQVGLTTAIVRVLGLGERSASRGNRWSRPA